MTQIFLILIAWLVPMPLWLSVMMTVGMSLSFILRSCIAIYKASKEEDD